METIQGPVAPITGKASCLKPATVDVVWKALLLWAAVDLIIFAIVQSLNLIAFTVLFGLVFGYVSWTVRGRLRPALKKAGLHNFVVFLLLAFVIGVFEELVCWGLGNRIANPVVWADLLQVCVPWLFWFATWYLFLAKRFAYSEKEALLLGASVGILYEGVSSLSIFVSPLLVVLMAPLAVVIYAAIFLLPLQLIDLKGTDGSLWKYPAGVFLPYLASLPMGIVFAIVLPK
jgi:hypothetical protein